jgi:hypothetical protein
MVICPYCGSRYTVDRIVAYEERDDDRLVPLLRKWFCKDCGQYIDTK